MGVCMNKIFDKLMVTEPPTENLYYVWFIDFIESLYGDEIDFHPDRLNKVPSQYFGGYMKQEIMKLENVVGIEIDMLFFNVLIQMQPTPQSNVPDLINHLRQLNEWRTENRDSEDPVVKEMCRKIRIFCNVLYGQMNRGKIWFHDVDQEDVSRQARKILATLAGMNEVVLVDMEEVMFLESPETEQKVLDVINNSGFKLDTIRHEYGRVIIRPNYISVQRYKK